MKEKTEQDNFQSKITKKPTCIIVLGMAGSGKTTFISQFSQQAYMNNKKAYIINLDPAVLNTYYNPNIDIRDTINYKTVMEKQQLGPNGAIMTSLNLYSTQFHQVLDFTSKKKHEYDYIIIDTPGQIEVFTWSASGQIISEILATTFPTIIAFVMDTPRCQNVNTFMSNMLYACSILYK